MMVSGSLMSYGARRLALVSVRGRLLGQILIAKFPQLCHLTARELGGNGRQFFAATATGAAAATSCRRSFSACQRASKRARSALSMVLASGELISQSTSLLQTRCSRCTATQCRRKRHPTVFRRVLAQRIQPQPRRPLVKMNLGWPLIRRTGVRPVEMNERVGIQRLSRLPQLHVAPQRGVKIFRCSAVCASLISTPSPAAETRFPLPRRLRWRWSELAGSICNQPQMPRVA